MIVNNTQISKEVKQMSRILDDTPGLLQVVFDDLVKTKRADTGRQGLAAEQVLRCAALKQYRQLSYEELAFHLDDSSAFRRFTRLDVRQYPSKLILQENIKAISGQSWEETHRLLIDYVVKHKIEKAARTVLIQRPSKPTSTIRQTQLFWQNASSTVPCDNVKYFSLF